MKQALLRTIIFTVVLNGLCFGCLNPRGKSVQQGKEKPEVIRLAYQLGHLPDIIAKNKQWVEQEFKDDNIAIKFSKFEYGPPEIEAFAAGNIDFGSIGDQPAIIGWAKGVDVQIVGNVMGSQNIMALLVSENSNINTFAELKGKKIGITIGSNIQHLFNLFLKQAGLKQSDLHVVNLQFSDCITALSLNQIDATILSEPYVSMATYKYKAKIIANSEGLKYVTLPYLASGDFIRNYPDLVVRLLKVYRRASDWAREHPREASDILAKEENGLLPREVNIQLIRAYTQNFGLNDSAITAFGETYKYLQETKIIQNNPDIQTLYTTEFDQEAFNQYQHE
jgi:sulfonate transport system substrate-binding protein